MGKPGREASSENLKVQPRLGCSRGGHGGLCRGGFRRRSVNGVIQGFVGEGKAFEAGGHDSGLG